MSYIEKILTENKDRFVLFPIKHSEIWNLYKRSQQSFWTASSADLSKDIAHWKNKLSKTERLILKRILALYTIRYKLGIDNALNRFISEVQYPEARCFYGYQLMQNNIHSEIYSWFCGTFLQTPDDGIMFDEIKSNPAVSKMREWIDNNLHYGDDFTERLIAYIVIQRIFYSASFCLISNFRLRELMPNLCMISTFIFNDESLFTDFGLSMYTGLLNKCDKDKIASMVNEASAIEKEVMNSYLLAGMPENLGRGKIADYIDYISERIFVGLGGQSVSPKANPFQFIVWESNMAYIDPHKEYVSPKPQEFKFSLTEDF